MSSVASKIQDLMGKLQTGEIKAQSELMLRNEEAQHQIRLRRFGKFEKALKKRSKNLVPLELAVPFDPYTGKVTEEYNKTRKFRPLLSATTTALILKTIANENPESKAEFERRANVEGWDTSDLENITEQDKQIFRMYRVPRIFTTPVAEIKDERVTGWQFAQKYSVSVDRDPITGALIGPMPVFLQANKLYREIAFEESAHIDDCIKKAKAGEAYELLSNIEEFHGFNLATIKDDDVKDIKKKKLWSKVWVSEDRPANYMVVYEIPMKNDLTVAEQATYATITEEEMDAKLMLVSLTKQMNLGIENYKNGTFAAADRNFDFWELDMICPTTVKDPNDKMEIGANTTYPAPQNPLVPFVQGTPTMMGTVEVFQHADKLIKAVRESLDNSQDWEERFLYSARTKKLDEDVENKILDIILERDELSNTFLTEKVLKANADFIRLVFGQEGDTALLKLDFGKSGRTEGALDEAAAHAEAKVNLTDVLEGDDTDLIVDNEEKPQEANTADSLNVDVAELSLEL